jgi:hypothetical protein
MKCPHCDYFYGYDFDKGNIKPKEGSFYYMPVKMQRDDSYYTEEVYLFACPKCRKTFIGE